MNTDKKFRIVDIFAGIGNFRAGFEQAGAECVYAIEWDKYKRQMYEIRFGEKPQADDIRGVRAGDIPDAEIWCFGSPCTSFSISGLRKGMDGESGLITEVFRLLKEKEPGNRPVWVLWENVKGALSSNRGWDFEAIQFALGELGYICTWQILDSQYFGVPQHRERLYLVGCLRDGCSRKVLPL